jgi:perosamine synthetase
VISSYRPYFDWSEILAVLRPGFGRAEFESAVASYVGARYALAFSYGRSAVVALFRALGLNDAEVIMPAYTCSVMAEAVVASGNKPVFVDINLADYNMDLSAITPVLTSKTRAIIATHMYGYPTDVSAIRSLVDGARVLLIEDAALALKPASSNGGGISGDITLFSFGRGKQLYSITGGVLATDSPSIYEKVKIYRDLEMSQLPGSVLTRRCVQVITAYMALSGSLEKRLIQLKSIGAVKRSREVVGLVQGDLPRDYAAAYADFQGRMGLAQLRKLDLVLGRNGAIAELYGQALHDVPGLILAPVIPGATYTYYSVRIKGRDGIRFRQRMWNKGIEVGLNFSYSLPQLKAYRSYARGQYPQAEQAAREVVNLPIYAGLDEVEVRRVVESTRHIMQECCS